MVREGPILFANHSGGNELNFGLSYIVGILNVL